MNKCWYCDAALPTHLEGCRVMKYEDRIAELEADNDNLKYHIASWQDRALAAEKMIRERDTRITELEREKNAQYAELRFRIEVLTVKLEKAAGVIAGLEAKLDDVNERGADWQDRALAAEAKLARVGAEIMDDSGCQCDVLDPHDGSCESCMTLGGRILAILSDTAKPLAVMRVKACRHCGTPRPREKWNDDNDLVCDPCGEKVERIDAIAIVMPKEVE